MLDPWIGRIALVVMDDRLAFERKVDAMPLGCDGLDLSDLVPVLRHGVGLAGRGRSVDAVDLLAQWPALQRTVDLAPCRRHEPGRYRRGRGRPRGRIPL